MYVNIAPASSTYRHLLACLVTAAMSITQGDLSTAKVPVAVKASGVDVDGHWTRQNLAQVIWYSLLLSNPARSPQLMS